jgi:3-oxoacyl-[acyl-carrier-protein] synthase II
MDPTSRVVVTGLGVVGPSGIGAAPLWSSLLEGRSCIVELDDPALHDAPARNGGPVPGFDPTPWIERRAARRMGRFSQMALVASVLAVEDAGLEGALVPERTGITIHTGAGGLLEGDEEVLARRESPGRTGPLYVPRVSANMAAANTAIHLGVTGPVTAGVGACAAGAIALVEAYHLLRRGEVDVVIAGGTDAILGPYLIASLANAGALSTANGDPTRVSRPFDLDRTGFVPAEGSAILVLEREEHARARGARIICELAGGAVGCDAYHITSPDPTGAGAERAIRAALRNAGEEPEGIGAVVAHGTGTKLNDNAEAAALVRVLGDRALEVPLTAPKASLGHTLGAAGAFGAVIAAQILADGRVPPTINYETPDPDCPVRVVAGEPLDAAPRAVLANAFAFGGQNAVLVLRRADDAG